MRWKKWILGLCLFISGGILLARVDIKLFSPIALLLVGVVFMLEAEK